MLLVQAVYIWRPMMDIQSRDPILQLDKGVINCCSEFKYLGSYIMDEGMSCKDIQNRIIKERIGIRQLNSILWSSKFRHDTKVRIYCSTYLSEKMKSSWKLEMDFLHQACRVFRLDQVQNHIIMQKVHMKDKNYL